MRPFAIVPVLFLVLAACSGEDGGVDDGDVGDFEATESAVSSSCSLSRTKILASASASRRRAIERGFKWLDADVAYSQSRYHQGYRTDCSGFVSMCWELGTSYTTATFNTGGGQSGPLGSFDKLLPGDALVRRSNGSGHIVLFLGWNDSSRSGACVLEQASTAADMLFRVRATSSLRSGGYKAIRADKLSSDRSSAAPDDDDDDNEPSAGTTGNGEACTNDGACNPGGNGAGQICEAPAGGGPRRCVAGCRSNAQCPGSKTCRSGQCR